jgi:hypothetical protein
LPYVTEFDENGRLFANLEAFDPRSFHVEVGAQLPFGRIGGEQIGLAHFEGASVSCACGLHCSPNRIFHIAGLAGSVVSRMAQGQIGDDPKPDSRSGENKCENGEQRRIERDGIVRRPFPEGGEIGLLLLAAFGCGIGGLILWGTVKWGNRLDGNRNRQRDT